MNIYIQTQILNMTMAARSFVQTCRLGALKDDGRIDPDEERILKRSMPQRRTISRSLTKSSEIRNALPQRRAGVVAADPPQGRGRVNAS